MKSMNRLFSLPYYLWLILFVFAPLLLVLYEALTVNGHFSFDHFITLFTSKTYITMMFSSLFYAFIITMVTLIIAYPAALVLTHLKHKQLWLMLIILPTWINLLLKAYAFMGILGRHGAVNQFLSLIGLSQEQLLFTTTSFVIVAVYIQIPFMIMPIFNALEEIDSAYISAAADLGASKLQTFIKIIWPLSLPGVKAGVQAVFIPSLSLFMLTRLIAGNRVITLGTAIEQHFLITQNWGLGSAIGVLLIIAMIIIMLLTANKKKGGKR